MRWPIVQQAEALVFLIVFGVQKTLENMPVKYKNSHSRLTVSIQNRAENNKSINNKSFALTQIILISK